MRRLVDECRSALAGDGPSVQAEFEVVFSDGLSLTTESLDEVLSEENPRHRSIRGLRIDAHETDRRIARLFPEPVFRIGDGAARHDSVKSVRSKLGWAIVATSVLTPLVRMLSGLIW